MGFRVPILRRLFHLTGGSMIPLAGLLVPQRELLMVVGAAFLALVVLEGVRLTVGNVNTIFIRALAPVLKAEEARKPTGATYLVASTLIAFFIFDAHVAVLSLLFVAVGDPVAGVVGEWIGRYRIGRKTLEGSLALLGASLAAGFAVVGVTGLSSFWIVPVGALVAAVVELSPVPLDDNLTVPLASGLAMTLLLG